MNVLTAPAATSGTQQRIRVMIVDDAVVVRGLFTRWVESEPDFEVVGSLRSAREAIDQMTRLAPDVVILDIEMPDLDGITALPMMLAKKRDLVVIMASTLTRRNAEISLRALSLGASDYIPKPDANREVTGSADFRRDLIEKIRQLGLRARRNRAFAKTRFDFMKAPAVRPKPAQEISLRPLPITPPRVLVIGASTGGPQALTSMLNQCVPVFDRAPVLITQHMPPTFTTLLAEHISRVTGRTSHEAQDGEEINAGTIYLAPGGKHMSVVRRNGTAVISIDDGPVINFCKPAVDPLFAAASVVWGSSVLGVVLTGMGSDGLRGAQSIVDAGGSIIAQDEATSVVWGMPGQVAQAGLCSAVLPLPQIAPKIVKLFTGALP